MYSELFTDQRLMVWVEHSERLNQPSQHSSLKLNFYKVCLEFIYNFLKLLRRLLTLISQGFKIISG